MCCWSADPLGCGGVGTPWPSPGRLARHPRPGCCWAGRSCCGARRPDGSVPLWIDARIAGLSSLRAPSPTAGSCARTTAGSSDPTARWSRSRSWRRGRPLPPSACLQVLPTVEAYGMAWISLEPQPPGPIPTIPEVRGLPVRTHRDRSDPLPRQRRRDHRQQHRLHPRRIRPLGSFGADQDPRVPVGTVQRSCFGISISYGEMPVARTSPPCNNRAPGIR